VISQKPGRVRSKVRISVSTNKPATPIYKNATTTAAKADIYQAVAPREPAAPVSAVVPVCRATCVPSVIVAVAAPEATGVADAECVALAFVALLVELALAVSPGFFSSSPFAFFTTQLFTSSLCLTK
jgi:hypothetical protein